jgi:hypothetical protein
MWKQRWWLALPLAVAVTIGSAGAASIHDRAGMFDAEAVREAEATLNQIERDSHIATTIETIDSLEGRLLDAVAREHAGHSGAHGLFILIPRQDRKIVVLASQDYAKAIPRERRIAIQDAFIEQFKAGKFDDGLKDGVQTVGREVAAAKEEMGGKLRQASTPPVPFPRTAPVAGRPVGRPQGGEKFGLGSLLGIGLVILAVLMGIRLLGRLFGGGGGYGAPAGPGMGRPGYGPGPGYGGGGGGFMSSLFGGIGGAMAGNWLYDQFSGRHHQGGNYADNTAYAPGTEAAPTNDPAGNEWVGGGSEAGDWGGGGNDGGGDWGGGGGGDWGGGGGGGDWGGGGGGDGGSW